LQFEWFQISFTYLKLVDSNRYAEYFIELPYDSFHLAAQLTF